jgi:DNA-binding transcriptional LysR family regulator
MKNLSDLWPGLDLRHLAAFRAVAETGSFAQAAKVLGYTQPAVSHQVATLERIAGHRFFDRGSGRGHATLTAAGRLFATHVDALETRFASAREDLDAFEVGDSAVLRVGAFQSVSARIVPELVSRLRDRTPAISVELTESADEEDAVARLVAGELDFAFTLLPLGDERVDAIELLDDPYYVACAPNGARRVEIESLRDLADYPIVAPRTCRSWTSIAEQLRGQGIEPQYAFRTDDNFAVKGLVKRGVGIAFVSRLTLDSMGDGLDVVPIDHLVPPRRIALAWSRDRVLLPRQELFISVVRETCDELRAGSA